MESGWPWPGSMTVSSASPELGEASETIDVEFTGDEFSVGFNAAYLMQAVTVMPSAGGGIAGFER